MHGSISWLFSCSWLVSVFLVYPPTPAPSFEYVFALGLGVMRLFLPYHYSSLVIRHHFSVFSFLLLPLSSVSSPRDMLPQDFLPQRPLTISSSSLLLPEPPRLGLKLSSHLHFPKPDSFSAASVSLQRDHSSDSPSFPHIFRTPSHPVPAASSCDLGSGRGPYHVWRRGGSACSLREVFGCRGGKCRLRGGRCTSLLGGGSGKW